MLLFKKVLLALISSLTLSIGNVKDLPKKKGPPRPSPSPAPSYSPEQVCPPREDLSARSEFYRFQSTEYRRMRAITMYSNNPKILAPTPSQ